MLFTQLDYLQWKAAAQAITISEADAVSFQEPNVAWNKSANNISTRFSNNPQAMC